MKTSPYSIDFSAAKRILKDGLLSIIMPAYKLEAIIEQNVRTVHNFLSGNIPFEIIVVDDGSRDGTSDAVRKVVAEHPEEVILITLPENGGKGNALREGLANSHGTHILLLDADLDLRPERLPNFFAIMEQKGAAIVIGSKRHKESNIDYPWQRRLASIIYYSIVRLLVNLPVTDTQTGMKLFTREAITYSFDRMLVKRYAFDIEMLAIAHYQGYKISEAPIDLDFGEKMGALSPNAVFSVMNDTLAIFYRLHILHYYSHVIPCKIATPPPKVSVVIACPGPSSYLTEAVCGLRKQTFSPHEIIIIPDSPIPPIDGTIIIPSGKIRPAEKRNLGIKSATGDIVAFLDDDASPHPKWLEQAICHFSRNDVGAVGGPAITPSNDPYLAKISGRIFASPLVSGTCTYRYKEERMREVDDLPSCNLLVRKNILSKIGGYNTRYWPGEDTILCLDIVNSGAKIIYAPFATVDHHRRNFLLPHLRQVGRYGKHRGFFARKFPQTSCRISYMIPSLFTLGLIAGPILLLTLPKNLAPYILYPYLATISLYLLLLLIFSFSLNPLTYVLTIIGCFLTHIWYGIRFLQGLIFGRMPKEVAPFDHGGTTN